MIYLKLCYHVPSDGSIQLDLSSVVSGADKEKDKERLAAKIGRRPSKADLKLRNIIRGMDSFSLLIVSS
jgi:hypothetical protein